MAFGESPCPGSISSLPSPNPICRLDIHTEVTEGKTASGSHPLMQQALWGIGQELIALHTM